MRLENHATNSSGSGTGSPVVGLGACAALLAAALLAGGCGGDCGPGDALAAGMTVTVAGETVTFGEFTSSPNNDCPPEEGGPTSLTVAGLQVDPEPAIQSHVTLCLVRPDEIGGSFELSDSRMLRIEDVGASLADGCILQHDFAGPRTGTIEFSGFCDDGLDPAGYAVTFDGTVSGATFCPDGAGGMIETPVTVELDGTVAVEAVNLDL